eukprot:363142-Chlamydomonas_euryale.AAC.13
MACVVQPVAGAVRLCTAGRVALACAQRVGCVHICGAVARPRVADAVVGVDYGGLRGRGAGCSRAGNAHGARRAHARLAPRVRRRGRGQRAGAYDGQRGRVCSGARRGGPPVAGAAARPCVCGRHARGAVRRRAADACAARVGGAALRRRGADSACAVLAPHSIG